MNINKTQIFEKCPYVILLDAGHGDDTPGKRSPEWEDGSMLYEWMYNREIQENLIELFQRDRISYRVICMESKDISLEERVRRANLFAQNVKIPCLYVSLHGNAAGTEEANGFEIFTSPGETKSDICASMIYEKVAQYELFNMRHDFSDEDPDKESRFTVLTKTIMPAVLIESGFYTNYEECQRMLDPTFQEAVSMMIHLGIRKIISKRLLDE